VTVKPYLDTRVDRKDNLYPVFICLRHGPKVKYIPTGYRINKSQWDKTSVDKSHPKHKVINSKILSIISDINKYYAECSIHGRPFNIDLAGTGKVSASFNDYLLHRAQQFDGKNQIIMAQKVRRLCTEITEVFGVLYFDQINQDALRKFETYLIMVPNTNNTRVKKFKSLGQFYQQAVNDGRASLPNPFKSFKILSKPVKKEKLTVEEIQKIADLQLQEGAVNDARNLFLFSYYCKGMRFENCIVVKRSDIRERRIQFKSNKGNKFISVRIHDKLNRVISCYKSVFIFPYLDHIPKDKKEYIKKIDVLNAVVNKNLKIVAALAGIKIHLTFHVARHSFASHLMHHTDSIHVIKESLGHSDYRTTEVYLKSLGDEAIDKDMDKLYGS
jgi:integrase/recombinase XerD